MMKSLLKILFVLQCIVLTPAYAQLPASNPSLGSYSWEAVKVVLSLAIVLGIFYLLISLFKKYSGMNMKADSSMRVVGGVSLGGKDKVVILEAGKVNILLGISNAGITKLHQFDAKELTAKSDKSERVENFGLYINKIMSSKAS